MKKLLKRAVLLTLLFLSLLQGKTQNARLQIGTDSITAMFLKLHKSQTAAQISEAALQVQTIIFSDSLFQLNNRLAETAKKYAGEKHPYFGMAIAGTAMLHIWRGEYEKALPLLEQGVTIFKNADKEDDPNYAFILNNLGTLYEKIGDFNKALFFYKRGLELRKKTFIENNPQQAILYPLTIGNLASLYIRMGDYKKALPLLNEAIIVREKTFEKDNPYCIESTTNLAQLYSKMGNYKQALPLLIRAEEVNRNWFGKDNVEYIIGLNNLAQLYKDMGEYDKALPLFEQVLDWRKRTLGEQHPQYAATMYNVALISKNSINTPFLFSKADNILINYLSRTYTSLSENEKMVFFSQESAQFNFLPSITFFQKGKDAKIVYQVYANELALKGMVLEDQQQVLRGIRSSGDSNLLRVYNRWRYNKALLGKLFLLPKIQNSTYFDSVKEAANQMEQQLSLSSETFRKLQQVQTITPTTISQKLTKGQAAIEFIRFKLYNNKWTDSTIYAAIILLPGDSNPRFVPLFEEKKIQHILKPVSNANPTVFQLYPAKVVSTKTNGAAIDPLYQLIWMPLENYLNGIHTIYYAPVGLLHRIAFQALRQNPTQMLIDNYKLHQLLSTRSIALDQQTSNQIKSAVIWGNIEYDLQDTDDVTLTQSTGATPLFKADTTASSFNLYAWDTRGNRGKTWSRLPGTKKEMDNISSVFGHASILINESSGSFASEEAFKALDGKSPQILHLATHGFFLPVAEANPKNDMDPENNAYTTQQNPMLRSGLILAGGNHAWKGYPAIPGKEDGILTAYDIAQLDLSHTDLVVLSACETALGDLQGNEGVIGLQRAFKLAGVKQMMLSLWRIPDKQTTELMTQFYKNWIGGQNTREALRSAQLSLKKKYAPYYWAGVVIIE